MPNVWQWRSSQRRQRRLSLGGGEGRGGSAALQHIACTRAQGWRRLQLRLKLRPQLPLGACMGEKKPTA